MNDRDKKLISDFFSKKLSKEDKKEFLKRATEDKEFMKEFINQVELEVLMEDMFGSDEEEEKDTLG